MLIEDNPVDIFINTKVINQSGLGAEVFAIPSAKKAIEYFQDERNIKNLPDLILLDIRMPDMDGFEFLEIFNALGNPHLAQIRIILLSSSLDPLDYDRARNNSLVIDFIPKPFTREKLLAIVN